MSTNKKKSPAKRGRKPDASSKSGRVRTLLATGMSAADIADQIGCTRALVYNVKASMNKDGGSSRGASAKKGATDSRASSAGVKRGPGRPRKNAAAWAGSAAGGLDGILAAVRSSEQERLRLRGALEKIQALLASVLA